MEKAKDLALLGLSTKEQRVFLALKKGAGTPLLLSRATKVSRPAVYAILGKLKKRRLVVSRIVSGKKHWELDNEQKIEDALYETKRAVLDIPLGRQEIHGASDSSVIIYRGREAIRKMFFRLFEHHQHERFSGLQGDTSTIGWNKTFSTPETNKLNRQIKNNRLIVKAILPDGWFEDQTTMLGTDWAKDFEGRTTRVNFIAPRYFNNGGQVWVFKDSLFLMALNEEIVIEVRNSEIQKCLLAVFEFIEDTSPTIDANQLLRNLITKHAKLN